jgi:hypothetical protein
MQLRYNQFVRKLHISRQELKPIKQSEKNDPKWIKYTTGGPILPCVINLLRYIFI